MSKDTKVDELHDNWKDMAFSLVSQAVKQSSANIVQAIHDRVDTAVDALIKRLIITALFLFGSLFVLVGFAQYLGAMLGISAYGYLIVGGGIICIAFLMHFARTK